MRLFSAIKLIETQFKFKCMSCEGEIVSFLLENGPSRPREIISNCNYSQVSIFSKLKDLTEGGWIKKESSTHSRQSLYSLDHNLLDKLYGDIGDLDLQIESLVKNIGDDVAAANESYRISVSDFVKIER